MPVDYEMDSKLKALAPVIDEHAEWFGHVNKWIFFPKNFKGEDKVSVPPSFQKWAAAAEGYEFVEAVTLEDLKKVFQELHMVAKGLMDKSSLLTETVTLKEYDDFTGLYENFVFKLRRLEQDCALIDSGLDIESGLRSARAMEIDISRELERLARRGNPFTLAVARIDNYEEFQGFIEKNQHKRIIAKLGQLIKKCIRSFDDAYRSGEAEFLMALKHSETPGGTAAVNRLRSFLQNEQLAFEIDGKAVPLTMSYCVASPVPGDTLAELLVNMRKDLDRWDEGGDTAMEYTEKSPLQRYIKEGE